MSIGECRSTGWWEVPSCGADVNLTVQACRSTLLSADHRNLPTTQCEQGSTHYIVLEDLAWTVTHVRRGAGGPCTVLGLQVSATCPVPSGFASLVTSASEDAGVYL